MKLQKFRWSKVYESSEEELVEFLNQRNINATRVHGEAMTDANFVSSDDQTLWCAEGSLKVHIEGARLPFQPGDAMRLPANSEIGVTGGISGYVYYVN